MSIILIMNHDRASQVAIFSSKLPCNMAIEQFVHSREGDSKDFIFWKLHNLRTPDPKIWAWISRRGPCNLWYNVLKNWKTGKAPFFTVIMGRSVKFFCLLNITHLPLWIIDTYHFPQKQDLVIFPRSKCQNVVRKKCWLKRALENPEQTASDHHL